MRPTERRRAPGAHRGGWSFKIGQVKGIDLFVHGTFLILLAWIALSHLMHGRGTMAALEGVLFISMIFGIVVLHELGHALVAAHYGIRTRDITLYPMGGIASLERIPEDPRHEFKVALAGPAVNLVLAAILFVLLALGKTHIGPEHVQLVGGSFLAKLLWVNVSLALFNLLPAFPMDGGRVLRAALAIRMGHERATDVAAHVGQAMALCFGLLGLFTNPMLLFIALFVWIGAQGEASLVRFRAMMRGVSVGQVMTEQIWALSPSDTVGQVADALIARGCHAFPVVDEGKVIGVVTKSDVLRTLSERGPDARVPDAMDDTFEATEPRAMLGPTLERLHARGGHVIVVVEHGRILGIVTDQGVGEMLTMRRALERHA